MKVDGVTYAIAYGVIFSRANMMDAICNDLPYCAEARFAEVPADLLDGR